MGAGLDLVLQLATEGRSSFTTDEAHRLLKRSATAVEPILRSLRKQTLITTPVRGLHVIVPPEHRAVGSVPADQLTTILFSYWKEPYYVGLLSASERLGATHQRPQRFQVVTAKTLPIVMSGKVEIEFIGRKNVAEIPTTTSNTARGTLRVSSPEATAFDLVTYSERAGGIDNVASVIAELAPQLGVRALTHLAKQGVSDLPVLQRLGYLLDMTGHQNLSAGLFPLIARVPHKAPLVPGSAKKDGVVDQRWRLLINHQIELEA